MLLFDELEASLIEIGERERVGNACRVKHLVKVGLN